MAVGAAALGAYSIYQEYIQGKSTEEVLARQVELRAALDDALRTKQECVRDVATLIEFDNSGGSNFKLLSEEQRANPWILLYALLNHQFADSAARDAAILKAIQDEKHLTAAIGAAAERHFQAIAGTNTDLEGKFEALRDDLRRFQNQVFAELVESGRPFPDLYVPYENPNPERKGASRFVYREQRVPFFGRQAEMGKLLDFLFGSQPFCWWVWTGRGGVGKSRLALELCLAAHELGWYAGFLERDPNRGAARDWGDVRPDYPLLIVVDYVTERADFIGKMVAKLQKRAARGHLNRRIRILLLERSAENTDHWMQEFHQKASNTAKSDIDAARYREPSRENEPAPPREMPKLHEDSLWHTIRYAWNDFASHSDPPLPEADDAMAASVLEKYKQVDADHLPLFAAFAGESMAQLGVAGMTTWNRDALVSHVLEREAELWREAELSREHANLAFVATLVRELHVDDLPTLRTAVGPGMLPESLNDQAVRRISCFTAPQRPGHIPPLEPDPLGECFLLTRYSTKNDNPVHFGYPAPGDYNTELYDANDRLLDAAWDFAPFNVMSVLLRTARDFPNRTELWRLCRQPRSSPAARSAWAVLVAELSHVLALARQDDLLFWLVSELISLTRKNPTELDLRHPLAHALNNRGATYGQLLGQSELAIADYSAVLTLEGATPEQRAKALNNRGATYGQLGQSELAIADFSAVLTLEGATPEQQADALYNRGVTYGQLGQSELTIADFSAVLMLEGATPEQRADALYNRGVIYGQLGQSELAIADYSAILTLEGAPPEQQAKALYNRGVTYGQLGQSELAITDYSAVLTLEGAPPEQRAEALYNRGATYGQLLGQSEQAIADLREFAMRFAAVLSLPPNALLYAFARLYPSDAVLAKLLLEQQLALYEQRGDQDTIDTVTRQLQSEPE